MKFRFKESISSPLRKATIEFEIYPTDGTSIE